VPVGGSRCNQNQAGALIDSNKGLNDGHRRAALIPFLTVANKIPGLLLNVAIDKNVPTIFL
jgi:hypothetical protein